jgi:hypothetical protein
MRPVSSNALLAGVSRKMRRTSVEDFTGPPIAVSPKRTARTDLAFGIVRSLFVGATDDAVRCDHSLGAMLSNESENPFPDGRVLPNVAFLREPTLKLFGFAVLRGNNADHDLAGALVIRTVERHGGNRIAPEAPTGLLLERGS